MTLSSTVGDTSIKRSNSSLYFFKQTNGGVRCDLRPNIHLGSFANSILISRENLLHEIPATRCDSNSSFIFKYCDIVVIIPAIRLTPPIIITARTLIFSGNLS